MEAATHGRTPPRSRPVEVGLVASLLVVAAGAWAVIGDRMGEMDAGPVAHGTLNADDEERR